MKRILSTADFQTPARKFILSETVTEYGGRLSHYTQSDLLWGQFKLDNPSTEQMSEGDFYTQQIARFTCRHVAGLKVSDRLRIGDDTYTVLAISQDTPDVCILLIERVIQ